MQAAQRQCLWREADARIAVPAARGEDEVKDEDRRKQRGRPQAAPAEDRGGQRQQRRDRDAESYLLDARDESGRQKRHQGCVTEPCRVEIRHRQSFRRSEEHTSELQSLMRISYAVFCLNNKKHTRASTSMKSGID